MYTRREEVLIQVALVVIALGFVVGSILQQTSPFVSIACLMLLGASWVPRNYRSGVKFSTCVIAGGLQLLSATIAISFYIVI